MILAFNFEIAFIISLSEINGALAPVRLREEGLKEGSYYFLAFIILSVYSLLYVLFLVVKE